ncbi:MAG: winged helix-turn-helix transcriptional regulator [Candidatus Helarchaeota archaeon]|nr:winged helix-turn-helix transcriptional regulator [Candidatus Helarchaeota archaeon]
MKRSGSKQQIKILNLLENEDLGLTISQVAKKINLNRNSTAKYLENMAEKGLIYKIEKGPTSKLFYPARKSKAFEERNVYMVKFYQFLHSVLFKKYFKDQKLAREIGLEMVKSGVAQLYSKQFNSMELSFENITQLAALAVEITYPIANVKAEVKLDPLSEDSFLLEIHNCICDGNKEYRSICEIQMGLLKGVIDEFIVPEKVQVKEIECKCDNYASCKYKITKLK